MIKLHQLHDFVYIHKVSTAYHQRISYKYIYIYISTYINQEFPEFSSFECHRIGSLIQLGSKLLSKAMLTDTYIAIEHHQATMNEMYFYVTTLPHAL